MADLDVAVRLKLVNLLSKDAKVAAKDLAGVGTAAGKLDGKSTRKFATELAKASSASAKLGGALDKTAAAAGRAAQGIRGIGQGAAGIDATRQKIERLTKAEAKLVSRRKAAVREAFREATSRVSPNGYLLGAVVAGAASGSTAAAVGVTGYLAARRATKEALDRDKALASVRKKVDLAPGVTSADLERKIGDVSRALGMSYSEAAEISAQGGQGNVAYKDLQGFAMLGAKVATAWDIGPREAAQTMTEVKAQTGWANAELERFAAMFRRSPRRTSPKCGSAHPPAPRRQASPMTRRSRP